MPARMLELTGQSSVIPAKAGIQTFGAEQTWIPASAGMTRMVGLLVVLVRFLSLGVPKLRNRFVAKAQRFL
jgi:hypothetical protein